MKKTIRENEGIVTLQKLENYITLKKQYNTGTEDKLKTPISIVTNFQICEKIN